MPDLTKISTSALVAEIRGREGVIGAATGTCRKPYGSGYRLSRVYKDIPAREVSANILILPDYLEEESNDKEIIWRRFELCFADGPEKDELYRLLNQLELSRRELALIVLGLRVRPGFALKDFDT